MTLPELLLYFYGRVASIVVTKHEPTPCTDVVSRLASLLWPVDARPTTVVHLVKKLIRFFTSLPVENKYRMKRYDKGHHSALPRRKRTPY